MVSGTEQASWSPTSWPVSFRRRLLATAVVLVATLVTIIALSRDGEGYREVSVVATTQRWPAGFPPGEHATVDVPTNLAVLFVRPADLADTVVTVEIPAGTLISPGMLRPRQGESGQGDARTTSLLDFTVNAAMWPAPGPQPGRRAVFAAAPGGCAVALVTLAGVAGDGSGTAATVEAGPDLAARLADEEWWIWESPPGGWPLCDRPPPQADQGVNGESGG